PDDAAKRLKLLWLSCGDEDTLMNANRAFHTALEEKKVPHVWHVDSGGHTFTVWKNELYLLAPFLFRGKGISLAGGIGTGRSCRAERFSVRVRAAKRLR